MCEFVDDDRGVIEPAFVIGISKGRDIIRYNQHFFNFPWDYEIIYQSIQKVQPPCADHVVREDEVFLR